MRSGRSGSRALAALALAAAACVPVAVTSPASAAAAETAGPVLTAATLDVRPQPASSTTTVRERITVAGVEEGQQVKNLLTRFDGVRVVGLAVTVAGERVPARTSAGGDVATVTFRAPAAGRVTYAVSYRVESDGANELPLLVPAYASGEKRVVAFTYRIPDGYHLRGSPFPVGIGTTGTQQRQLLGVPTFLDYRLGTRPTGALTPFNLLGAAVVALVVGLSVVVIVREAKAGRRGETSDV